MISLPAVDLYTIFGLLIFIALGFGLIALIFSDLLHFNKLTRRIGLISFSFLFLLD